MPELRTVSATRYVTPLREGGSLPGLVEADDDGLYVVKFRGAGQGIKALIAELLVGEIGRALGLPVPELVFLELDAALGRNEADSDIKDLIEASVGTNIGLDFLPGSLPYDPLVAAPLDPQLASAIVWFDAYTTNVDRTARNTNMLLWHRQLRLIDHGAALYVHHSWANWQERIRSPFVQIKDHVLLPQASELEAIDAGLAALVTPEVVAGIIGLIPEGWLAADEHFGSASETRAAYQTYLQNRLESPRLFVEEAASARARAI